MVYACSKTLRSGSCLRLPDLLFYFLVTQNVGLKVDHPVTAAGAEGSDSLIGSAFAQFFQVLFFFALLLAAIVAEGMPALGTPGPTFLRLSCMAA